MSTSSSYSQPHTAVPYTSVPATVLRIEAVVAGTVAAGAESVSFVNIGTANATVQGVSLLVGESVGFTAFVDPVTSQRRPLPDITYVGSATGILHITDVR
jgi:hypothetical protein